MMRPFSQLVPFAVLGGLILTLAAAGELIEVRRASAALDRDLLLAHRHAVKQAVARGCGIGAADQAEEQGVAIDLRRARTR